MRDGKKVVIAKNKLLSDLQIYYRTKQIGTPKLIYQKCDKYPDEVAVMVGIMPTFEAVQPQDIKPAISYKDHGEELDEVKIDQVLEAQNEKTCFIFLIDRSFSMNGMPMHITKEALKLFMKSLPEDSKF